MNHCYDASSDESDDFYMKIALAMTLEGENVRHGIERPEIMIVSNETYQKRSNQEKLNGSAMPSAVDMEQLRRR